MAKCFACGEKVPYLATFKGYFKYLRKNFRRKTLIVYDCPHCRELCQESAVSYFSSLLTFFSILILFLFSQKNFNPESEPLFIGGFLFFYFCIRFFWWNFFAKLKEPYIFYWE